MAKNTLESIRKFTESKEFAFIGISRDPKKFSRSVYKELLKKGYKMHPVNPNIDTIDGARCYKDMSELPAGISHALVMTPKAHTAGAVEHAIQHGIQHIWLQQGAETQEALEVAKQNGVNLVYGACIMMHTDPEGVHKFHRFLSKLFGAYPK
jgi:predicted CoA-binding protein